MLDHAFLFLYRKIEQTSVFSSKKNINWVADVSGKIKPSNGRSIGRSIHDGPQENTNSLMDLPFEVVGCAC